MEYHKIKRDGVAIAVVPSLGGHPAVVLPRLVVVEDTGDPRLNEMIGRANRIADRRRRER